MLLAVILQICNAIESHTLAVYDGAKKSLVVTPRKI